ncbi:MAG: site-2 protease family protein [Pseudomonadota bacterium]
MPTHIKLGRIWGIDIGLHYSWLIIALLIVLSLAGHFTLTNPQWGAGVVWTLAVITAALFFTSIVVHELSHALVAKMRRLPVKSITLFALGGVANIEKEAGDAKTEFWMGIIGPITSAVIGAVCLGLASVLGWRQETTPATPLLALLVWLGYINIVLAAFNMIPGFPMDGGRVLRAILWWITGNASRATRSAARVGQFIAFGFIVIGIFRFFGGAGFGGLWLAFIGWFLLEAARASQMQVDVAANLQGVRVRDIMGRDCPVVDGRMNVRDFVDDYLLRSGGRYFIIEENGAVAGLVTPRDIKDIERARWPYTVLRDVMRPLDAMHSIAPDAPASEALEKMGRNDLNQLPVLDARGRLQGVISRGHILQFLETRAELNM